MEYLKILEFLPKGWDKDAHHHLFYSISIWTKLLGFGPDRPWGPPSFLYNGYRVFPEGKVRPGRAADHSPPSSASVMEE